MSARSTQKHKNSGESAGLTARLTAPQETAARARRQQATLIEGGDERPPSRSGRATESPLRRVFFSPCPTTPAFSAISPAHGRAGEATSAQPASPLGGRSRSPVSRPPSRVRALHAESAPRRRSVHSVPPLGRSRRARAAAIR